MSSILTDIIKKKVPFWNDKIITEDDLHRLCRLSQARYFEDEDMKGRGEYLIYENTPFVIVNKNLKREMKLWVGLHELGHHLLHYPVNHKFSAGTRRKLDREANYFAAIALIPTELVKSMTWGEIIEEYNYPKILIRIRKEINTAYRI